MAGSRVLRSVSCFSAAISATVSDTRGVVLPRCHTAVLHAASSLIYDVPSTVLVSRCDTAILRTSTLYDVPSTVLVSWCDTAILRTSTLYDVPSTVLVSWCDTAVLRTPPSTTSPPSCSSPGVTLLSYGPPPLSATTSPPPFCFPVPPNTLATTNNTNCLEHSFIIMYLF